MFVNCLISWISNHPTFQSMFNIMVRKLSTNTTITLSDDSFPMASVRFNRKLAPRYIVCIQRWNLWYDIYITNIIIFNLYFTQLLTHNLCPYTFFHIEAILLTTQNRIIIIVLTTIVQPFFWGKKMLNTRNTIFYTLFV